MKQEIQHTFKRSGYFVAPVEKKDVERYFNKDLKNPAAVVYDKTIFPRELFDDKTGKKSKKKACNLENNKMEIINFEKSEPSKSGIEESLVDEGDKKGELEAIFSVYDDATSTESEDLDSETSALNYWEISTEEVLRNKRSNQESSDEDTDYTRSYFDNGEDYLQDDDLTVCYK